MSLIKTLRKDMNDKNMALNGGKQKPALLLYSTFSQRSSYMCSGQDLHNCMYAAAYFTCYIMMHTVHTEGCSCNLGHRGHAFASWYLPYRISAAC